MGGPAEADLPEEPIDRQLLLTNATLYWLTRTAGSSSWTYYEGAAGMPVDQTKVPTGVSHAEPGIRRLAERKNTIVHWSDNHSLSHMVAMAVPNQLVGDIREFFRRLR
jgi:epoxide hydrolase